MANKKITVLGDVNDPSLTSEEEHKIEVKVDRMLSVDRGITTDESSQPLPASLDNTIEIAPMATDTGATDAATITPATAPPLAKGAAKKIAVVHSREEAQTSTQQAVESSTEEQAGNAVLKPAELPSSPLKINVSDPELEVLNTPSEIVSPNQSDTADTGTFPPLIKKYRPPDGPLPFKRAVPSANTATEVGTDGDELMLDGPQDSPVVEIPRHDNPTSRKSSGNLRQGRRFGRLLIFMIVVGLLVAVAATPSVRHRLSSRLHKTQSPQVNSMTTTSTNKNKTTSVPTLPDVFIAKKGGTYNLYKLDISSHATQQLLAGSGYETSPTTQLVANNDGTQAALVSHRDASKDAAGYPLQTFDVVNVATAAVTTLGQAQHFQIVGWHGDTVVYVVAKTGPAAATDPNAYQLVTYNVKTKQKHVLDHALHFNKVLAVHDSIFYATAGTNAALYRVQPDGNAKQTIRKGLISGLYRSGYNTLTIATAGSWYTLDVSAANSQPVATANAYDGTNKLFVDAPGQRHSLHVELQNNTPTLLLYDLTTKKDTVLSQAGGLSYPVHWLNSSTAVYRVDTDAETADYTVNITNGAVAKLIDTSSFHGLEP